MLILSRKVGEAFLIGDSIKINILKLKGKQVSLGIEVPPDMKILKEELRRKEDNSMGGG